MGIKIALAGNPNAGKTTLFNALTGSNQFVGNWPGVTVEKKEGKLKGHKDVIITDLPGIYSLSPYTLEEVVARNYLIQERPDAILNIIDGTNLERNLYLTTQLVELGIPVVVAINMMDIVRKNGDQIRIDQLAKEFCISPTSLKSNFKQVYSTTIKDYLRRERMERASALLLTTSSTVADIAASLGYTNQSKFSAAFKAVHGLTPVEYRRKCRHERKD